jgi:death-on-curing protein
VTIYLSIDEVLLAYEAVMEQSGGLSGIRDRGLLESALAQPQMAFGGEEFYPTLPEKAAALGLALIKNHAFLDGNKRIGYAAIRLLLGRNGFRIVASVDEREALILGVAAGDIDRVALAAWLEGHIVPR